MTGTLPARPLDGIRIIDFSRQMSAPYGTVLLSDFGADVIKVESLPSGDPSRRTGVDFDGDESALFLMWNRGKRSIALDLRSEEGLGLARHLARSADVVIENYRPGVADEIGIGYAALAAENGRLVYCSVSAFGASGPLADAPGTDPVVQAMSGVMALTGEPDGPPVLVGVPIADFTGAMLVVQGVLLGLAARERTGEGQRVDVSMLAGLVYALTTRLASYWATGREPRRNGSAHSVTAPYQAFETADGAVVAGAWAPEAWPRFCAAIDRDDLVDDPRFRSNANRVANRAELDAELGPILRSRTTAEWEARFRAERALFSPIRSVGEVLAHPQMARYLREVDHPTLGPIRQLAPPIELSATPARLDRSPPVLGQHSREVLAEVGLADEAIDRLVAAGVVLDGGLPDGPVR